MERRNFLKLIGITSISPAFLFSKEKLVGEILEVSLSQKAIEMPNGYEFVCINCDEQRKINTYWPLKGDETSEFRCFCGKKLTYIKNDTDFDLSLRKYAYIPPNDESHPRAEMRYWT